MNELVVRCRHGIFPKAIIKDFLVNCVTVPNTFSYVKKSDRKQE